MSLLPLELKLKTMRPYQERSYTGLRKAVAEKMRCPVLYLPTGAGKTVIAAHLIANSLQRHKRPLFIVPLLSLIEKTILAFEDQGITDIGVIQGRHERTNRMARVQIASMQTLIKRPQLMRGFDLVIVDEAHECYQEMYAWMKRDEKTVFVGLSATPWAKGMGLHWSGLVMGATVSELLECGAICPFEVYEPGLQPNRKKQKIVAGEFSDAQAQATMSDKALVADVYDMWVARGAKARWFVFGQNCNHTKLLMQSFMAKGVECGYIDADTCEDERKRLFEQYREMQVHVLFSVGCLGTGIDEDVQGISLAYMTRSRIKLTQDLGRGGRPAEGKTRCIVNDHGGNIAALGMPEEYTYDHLDCTDPKEKGDAYAGEKEPPKPKKCGKCFRLLPAKTSVCPQCGERTIVCNVETVEGELVKREKKESKEKYTMNEKQAWWGQCLGLAEERKWSRGRASHLYKDKFGVFPRGLIDLPTMPERSVISFEKHRCIAYAKAQESARKAANAGGVNIGQAVQA